MLSKLSIHRTLLAGFGLALAVALSAQAQAPAAPAADTPTAATKGPPADFAAPAAPQPGESNAERARTQPGNNAPFWRGVRDSGDAPGVTSLPGVEKGILVQSFVQYPGSTFTTAGEAWRQVRNNWLIPYGGALLSITVLAIALFYWRRGTIGADVPEGGRLIERFTPFERAAHWANAIAFVALAISGVIMAFGKFFLLPVLGGTLFGWLTYALKNLHNFAGPLFAVSLIVVLFTFVRDNMPSKEDLAWLRKGGGLFGGEHVSAHRFNAGEKIVFWGGVLFLGFIVIGSGLFLDHLIPGVLYVRGDMQIAHMIHLTASLFMMAMFIGHIYLGTIGTKGAYKAMRTGYVDERWAQEHHDLWAEDVRAGKIPAQRSGAAPAALPGAHAQT